MKLLAALLTIGFLVSSTGSVLAHSKSRTTVYVKKTYVTKSVRHKRYHYHVRSHRHYRGCGHRGYGRPRAVHHGYGRGYAIGHRTGGHH